MTTEVTIFEDVFTDARCPQFDRDWGQRMVGRVPRIGMTSWVAMGDTVISSGVDFGERAVYDELLAPIELMPGITAWL